MRRACVASIMGGLLCLPTVITVDIEAAPAETAGVMRHDAFPGRNGKIALTTRKPSSRSLRYLLLVDPDGEGAMYVGQGYAPAWSPDGTRILFLWNGALAVMRADGSGRRLIDGADRGDDGHDWSPDGSRIVVAWSGGGSREDGIWILRGNGAQPRRLLDTNGGKFAYSDVKWSPDGRRIAFTRYSYAADRRTVFSVRISGGGVSRVSPGGASAVRPTWSPDSKRIAYLALPDDCRKLPSVAITTVEASSQTLVAKTEPTRDYNGCGRSDVAWSPDGESIAYTNGRWVHIMDVDGSNSRRVVPMREVPYDGALSWQPLPSG